jgi:Haem-degrading
MNIQRWLVSGVFGLGMSMAAYPALADLPAACSDLKTAAANLDTLLSGVVRTGGNGGLGFNMWATLVANDGTVCAVAFSGTQFTDQWLASRIISAQKANTANGLSLGEASHMPSDSLFSNGLALSTANLYTAVQPGGSLYGLQHSNPVDADIAYLGSSAAFGTGSGDPLVGTRVGGINVFGGGLVLLAAGGKKVGGIGVSGDTSCTDHMVAWKLRNKLGLDHFGPKAAAVGGVAGDAAHPDNIVFDITQTGNGGMLNPVGKLSFSAGGFGHPTCLNNPDPSTLPAVQYP